MEKPIKPDNPNCGKLDWQDHSKLDRFSNPDGKEKIVFYSDWESMREDDYDCDESCDYCDGEGCEECEKSEKAEPIGLLTLQDIINKLPNGFTPGDVKVEFGYSANCMAYEDTWIRFSYRQEVDLQVELDKYAKEKERYEKEMVGYKRANKEYKAWKRAQAIAEAKAKLEALENSS